MWPWRNEGRTIRTTPLAAMSAESRKDTGRRRPPALYLAAATFLLIIIVVVAGSFVRPTR